MLVFHHNDADGRCAAAIVKRWHEQNSEAHHNERIVFQEMDYKDPVNFALIEEETVVVVDFSLKPDDMNRVCDLARFVVWCDHHATAKDYNYNVLGLRDFIDKGLSGCELTWRYFFPDDEIPYGIRLLGDYDAWRLETAPLCFRFYEGLKLEDQRPQSLLWQGIIESQDYVNRIMERGLAAIKYRDNYCRELRHAFGYETTIAGNRAYALNAFRFGSGGHGEKFKEYPVCIAYIHDGTRFTVSLYSETVDVGAIAKSFGGGGHKGAAGFVCEHLPFYKEGGA